MIIYLIEEFTKHIDIEDVTCLLELGARDGYDTKPLLDYYKPERLFSIDANPNAKQTIENSVAPLEQVTFSSIALSDEVGEVHFYLNLDCPGSSSVHNHPTCRTKHITVPATTLDLFCKDNDISRLDLICADVEGAEPQIFKDQKILHTTKYIICESKFDASWKGLDFPGLSDLKESLEPFGFEMVEVSYAPGNQFGDTLWVKTK